MHTEQASLIEYYEAFEALLNEARTIGEYRTHFGFLETPSPDYCFFKAICKPREHVEIRREAQSAMDRLHVALFGSLTGEPTRVLDVGFGCGGTLGRLAQTWPGASIHGINLNPVQFAIAQQQLGGAENVTLHLGDFLTHGFGATFDLVYFIESAFHIADKAALVNRLSGLLAPGGQAFIVDIFYSERLQRRAAKAQTQEQLFDYRTLDEWQTLLSSRGLAMTSFEDWTLPVSNHTRVNTPEDDFVREMVAPVLPAGPRGLALEQHLVHAYHGYSRLSRLLASNLLHYGILRCTKS